jgi:MFS family permease
MRIFFLVLLGHLASLIASGVTGFALGVWVYQLTGSATQFALISFFTTLPGILSSPFAGVLVDRSDRKWVIILGDVGAALCTLSLAVLFLTEWIAIWHIYIIVSITSVFISLQWPAYMASITLLVPKSQYGRAGGLVQSVQATAQIMSPLLAGALIVPLKLYGVMLLNTALFLFSISLMLLVKFPRMHASREALAERSLVKEALYGWSYIKARRGLAALLLFFTISNFLVGIVTVMITPLMLSFSSASTLGIVLTVSGSGFLAGGLLMSIWGGPQRKIHAVLGFTLLEGVSLMVAGFRASAVLISIAAFVFLFSVAMVTGANHAIWQSKVAPEVQGRIFAARRMISWSSLPLAYAISGPLVDRIFEPLLAVGGPLAGNVGLIIGVGAGRGTALLLLVAGVITFLIAALSFLYPPLRLLEDELPDATDSAGAALLEETVEET